MKKVLVMLCLVAFVATSCKKESEVKPSLKAEKGIAAKNDSGKWD